MKKKQPLLNFSGAAPWRRRWFTMLDLMLLPGLVYLIINNYSDGRPLLSPSKNRLFFGHI